MKRLLIVLVVLVAALAASWFLMRRQEAPHQHSATAGKTIYYCPMHPQQRSDKPGNCPICNMKMVPLETEPKQEGPKPEATHPVMSPDQQQLIGVKTVAVERRALFREIRTVGKVAIDETRITHIHSKFSGFLEAVFVDFVGKPVRAGDPLFTIYSPELLAAQEEYLLALRSAQSLGGSKFDWVANGSKNLIEAARRRLTLWDISDEEVATIEREGKSRRALTIYSPVSGIVTERAAYHHGRYVTPEMDIYMIVDLSQVWILGDVYESDLPLLRPGLSVAIEFPFAQGSRRHTGTIAFLSPTLDPKTRTAKMRIELPNPDLALRPDMFLQVQARVPLPAGLAVPEDAVFDTGAEQYVFVDQGEGHFAPRRITTAGDAQGYYAVTAGLRAGERVVTSANFLLDADSRLRGAFTESHVH